MKQIANPVHISALLHEMHLEAARLLAAAFVTNPLHMAAFGPGAQAKNEAFFRLALASMRGPKSVALIDSRVVGVIHWTDSPSCQFSTIEKLRKTSYLETDRPENVDFYRRFGFATVQEEPVPGVPNFFMSMQAKSE
jgi:hypothetical protein